MALQQAAPATSAANAAANAANTAASNANTAASSASSTVANLPNVYSKRDFSNVPEKVVRGEQIQNKTITMSNIADSALQDIINAVIYATESRVVYAEVSYAVLVSPNPGIENNKITRVGNLVTLTFDLRFNSGSQRASIGTLLFTIPEHFRPYRSVAIATNIPGRPNQSLTLTAQDKNNGAGRVVVSGFVDGSSQQDLFNGLFNGTVSYLCKESFPQE
jgi:hypothetical protein